MNIIKVLASKLGFSPRAVAVSPRTEDATFHDSGAEIPKPEGDHRSPANSGLVEAHLAVALRADGWGDLKVGDLIYPGAVRGRLWPDVATGVIRADLVEIARSPGYPAYMRFVCGMNRTIRVIAAGSPEDSDSARRTAVATLILDTDAYVAMFAQATEALRNGGNDRLVMLCYPYGSGLSSWPPSGRRSGRSADEGPLSRNDGYGADDGFDSGMAYWYMVDSYPTFSESPFAGGGGTSGGGGASGAWDRTDAERDARAGLADLGFVVDPRNVSLDDTAAVTNQAASPLDDVPVDGSGRAEPAPEVRTYEPPVDVWQPSGGAYDR